MRAEKHRFCLSARHSDVLRRVLRQSCLEEPPGQEHEDETFDDQGADFGGDVLDADALDHNLARGRDEPLRRHDVRDDLRGLRHRLDGARS